ncbi:MAG: hypothetical protein ABIN54_09505 [candidate division WOR-3 bacterium]
MPKATTLVVSVLAVSLSWAGSAAQHLSKMDEATRENALIGLEWAGAHTNEMTNAEYLWNTGRYSEAISAIEALEAELGDMCLGISWRKPIETESPKWGTDVRVTQSSYDISDIELVKAQGNNNLFVVAMGSYGADTCWTLNISTNGGSSWSETYRWNLANGYELYDVDAAEYPGYIYVVYASSYNDSVWTRRFSETNGSHDDAFGFKLVIGSNSEMWECNLEPNRYSWDELYCGVINSSRALLYTVSFDGGSSWTPISTGVTDAYVGLDMDYGFMAGAQHYLWLSYLNATPSLCAKARIGGSWEDHPNLAPSAWGYTRIAQHGDTVLILYADTGNLTDLKYRVTYNDGGAWTWGTVYDSTDAGAFDITGRGGQGWQAAFCDYYASGPETMKYRRRTYQFPPDWEAVQSFGNHDAFFNYHSSIDYLGASGAYGVAYIDDNFDVWFDRLDWGDVAESAPKPLPMEFKALPGPGKTTLSFVLPQEGFASLRIYDVRGALVRDLSGNYKEGMNRVEFVPDGSGTFFAILVAGGQQARTKFVTVK